MVDPLGALISNGWEMLKQGDAHGAEALFMKAHLAFPSDPVPLFLLGMMRLNSNDFIQAEALFRRALVIAPDQPQVCTHLARALRKQNRPAEAIQVCRVTIAAEPDNKDAHLELAKSLDECDRFAEAEAAYVRILNRVAEPRASLGLGSMLNRMGRSEDAEAVLRHALKWYPSDER